MDSFLITMREIGRLMAFQVLELLPYIIGGVVLGELLKLKSWTRMIYKATTGRPKISVAAASLLGIASPLCTYGTIPVAISLYGSGVPLAPLISFIACSSLLNPQFIIYTYGQIGLEMTVLRIVTVFLIGIIFGGIVHMMPDRAISKDKLNKSRDESEAIDASLSEAECAQAILARKDKDLTLKQFLLNCLSSFEYIAFYMFLGILIGVLIQVFMPPQTIYSLFSGDKWYSVITAAILGVPLYQCGGGVIPVIANLMTMGMGYGQAITFFLVGPATNFRSIAAIASIIKGKYVAAYVAGLIIIAILFGYLYEPVRDLFIYTFNLVAN